MKLKENENKYRKIIYNKIEELMNKKYKKLAKIK